MKPLNEYLVDNSNDLKDIIEPAKNFKDSNFVLIKDKSKGPKPTYKIYIKPEKVEDLKDDLMKIHPTLKQTTFWDTFQKIKKSYPADDLENSFFGISWDTNSKILDSEYVLIGLVDLNIKYTDVINVKYYKKISWNTFLKFAGLI